MKLKIGRYTPNSCPKTWGAIMESGNCLVVFNNLFSPFQSLFKLPKISIKFRCTPALKKDPPFLFRYLQAPALDPVSALLLSQSLSGPFFRIPSPSSSKQAIIVHKAAIFFCRFDAAAFLKGRAPCLPLCVAPGTKKCKPFPRLLRKSVYHCTHA